MREQVSIPTQGALDKKSIKGGESLLIPPPTKNSFKITGYLGLDQLPNSIVNSNLFPLGKTYTYEELDAFSTIANFIFRGDSQEQIRENIQTVIDTFSMKIHENT